MTMYSGPLDLTPIGTIAASVLETYRADIERATRHNSDVQLSAAEVDLAVALKKAGVVGWQQQTQVGPYFVDFVFGGTFAVEVDGQAFHTDRERERQRDRYLLDHGIDKVWHFRALEVFIDAAGCVDKIVRQWRQLPPADQLRPRGANSGPPKEEEKQDAIRILERGSWNPDNPATDHLYMAAELVLVQATDNEGVQQ